MNNLERLKLLELLKDSLEHRKNFLRAYSLYKARNKSKRTKLNNDIKRIKIMEKLLRIKYRKLYDIIYDAP